MEGFGLSQSCFFITYAICISNQSVVERIARNPCCKGIDSPHIEAILSEVVDALQPVEWDDISRGEGGGVSKLHFGSKKDWIYQ